MRVYTQATFTVNMIWLMKDFHFPMYPILKLHQIRDFSKEKLNAKFPLSKFSSPGFASMYVFTTPPFSCFPAKTQWVRPGGEFQFKVEKDTTEKHWQVFNKCGAFMITVKLTWCS